MVALVRGSTLLQAARIGAPDDSGRARRADAGQAHAAELAADALHRALGAGARGGARLAPSAGRTLVAMSGGVDSAMAALLVSREGRTRWA